MRQQNGTSRADKHNPRTLITHHHHLRSPNHDFRLRRKKTIKSIWPNCTQRTVRQTPRHPTFHPSLMNETDAAETRSWGTWEELLLAFAVNRYGTADWDSIASELKRRTSDPTLTVTAHNCRVRYIALKRRFVARNDDSGELDGCGGKSNADDSVPLLEELRKLRVAELRREVERYDLNIESLELKMKRMEEEERERNQSDLEKERAEKRDGERGETPTPAEATGEKMEKDQLSVNESNSTDPQADKSRTGEKESKPARDEGEEERMDLTGRTSEEPAESKPERDRKSVREDSCNGSSNSIDEPDRQAKSEPVSVSADVAESEAGSDGGGEEAATKENSDVQSSASKSRKEGGSDKVVRGTTSGDEIEHEDQSRAVQDFSPGSQPLVDFLRSLRAHKLGSVFERRLRSQESSKYQELILQHVDIETVESRLKEGYYYSGSSYYNKFFRDLLLLVNNALVFFPNNSTEANAASEIRRLISKEVSLKSSKSDSSYGKQVSLQSLSPATKDESEPSSALPLLKPRLSGPLIVCRKRSSITAKANNQGIQPPSLTTAEEKDKRPQLSPPQETKITKKRTRDRFSSVSANSKKNGKNQPNSSGNKNTSVESGKQQSKGQGGNPSQQAEIKSENKKGQPVLESKRRGAANFLNRMKQTSSPTNNGVLLDALKNTPLTSNSPSSKVGSDTKKIDHAKRGEKKEQSSVRSSETKPTKEKEKPGKRNVGRPPKRAAAPPPPPPPTLGKRVRERVEVESASSKQPKKRTRKL